MGRSLLQPTLPYRLSKNDRRETACKQTKGAIAIFRAPEAISGCFGTDTECFRFHLSTNDSLPREATGTND